MSYLLHKPESIILQATKNYLSQLTMFSKTVWKLLVCQKQLEHLIKPNCRMCKSVTDRQATQIWALHYPLIQVWYSHEKRTQWWGFILFEILLNFFQQQTFRRHVSSGRLSYIHIHELILLISKRQHHCFTSKSTVACTYRLVAIRTQPPEQLAPQHSSIGWWFHHVWT